MQCVGSVRKSGGVWRTSAARTRTKISISMMRPNRKGNRGPRMARTTKNPRNRDHGRVLWQCEKAQSGRRYGDGLVWFTRRLGNLSIPEARPEHVEGGHKARRVTRTSSQIVELHSAAFAAHVNHRGPGCLEEILRKSRY